MSPAARLALVVSSVAVLLAASCGTNATPPSGGGDPDAGGVGSADGGDGADAGSDAGLPGPCAAKTLADAGDYSWSLTHEARTRTFDVHVPKGYDRTRATALVMNFHGFTSDKAQQAWISEMLATSDQYGFIVVHANGLNGAEAGASWNTADRSWNAGACCGPAQSILSDDVGFVSKMIDQLSERLCVDPKRIYSTGLSNGGFLSHRLGCELSHRVAAIGPVAAVNGMLTCSPPRAVPVLQFHGTKDTLVPYGGNSTFISVRQSMDDWAARNGCQPTSQVASVHGDVTCDEYSGCDAGADTVLCTVADGGHVWPGGKDVPIFGYNTHAVKASDELWKFFAAHPLP